MKYRIVLSLLTILGGACSDDNVVESSPLWSERDVVSERTFLPAAFDTLWRIGGATDTTLLHPTFLSAGREGVTVWDHGRKTIVRITFDGNVAWSFGREGEGPGEFRSVRDVAHLPGGGAATVDNLNRRLTIIGSNGKMSAETSFDNALPYSVASLPDGGVAVLTNAADPFLLFDKAADIVDSLGFPWESYRDMPEIAREGKLQATNEGWIFGFISGNGWWRFGKRYAAEAFPYAEHSDFPAIRTSISTSVEDGVVVTRTMTTRLLPDADDQTAVSFGVRGDTLFVHFGGSSAWRWRLLDLFNLSDGAYLGSIRLPFATRQIAVGPNAIYGLSWSTYPTLVALVRRKREESGPL